MGEWKEFKLGNVVDVLNGYAFKSDEFSACGIPVIKIKNVASGKLKMDDVQYYPRELTEKIKKFEIREKDILIAMTGSHITQPSSMVGRSCRYDLNGIALLNQRVGKIFSKDGNQLNEDFLFYFLKQDEIANELALSAGGSANQANISSEQIKSLQIYLPPLPEQKSIASILSSLDDKIDLLHRQNKTLEALAETLFRQWFVEEAEEGWEIGKLGDVISIYDSKRIPVSSMEREKMKFGVLYPYYGAASIMDYVNDYIFDGEYILMGEDGTVQTEDGYPVLQMATGKFWVNNHAHVFQAVRPYSNFLIYTFLKQTNVSNIVTGAVQPKINQDNLKSVEFPLLPDEKVNEFVLHTNSYWEKIKSINDQICTLTRLRDTLLPKLMSGEVRVNL